MDRKRKRVQRDEHAYKIDIKDYFVNKAGNTTKD